MDDKSQKSPAPKFKLARKPLPASRYAYPKAAVYDDAGQHDSWGYSTIDEVSDHSSLTSPKETKSPTHVSFEGRLPWLWESLSCCVALIALIAVVLTLGIHNNKPIPSWPRVISINSLIAIFSGILKAALLLPVSESISELKWIWYATPQPLRDFDYYDGASRGPFGSFLFLVRRPKNVLTSTAALITILALAVDPFTQQVVQYKDCSVAKDGEVALVPKANVYDSSGGILTLDPTTASPDAIMSSAIYRALYDPFGGNSSSQVIPVQCATGTCSFSMSSGFTYRSLTMCSNITDRSADVKQVHSSTPYAVYDPVDNVTETGEAPFVTYTLDGLTTAFNKSGEPCLSMRLTPGGLKDTGEALVTINALMVTSSCVGDDTCPMAPLAFRVSLYPCVNAYGTVKVSNFQLDEQLLSSIPIPRHFDHTATYYSIFGDMPASPGIDCSLSDQPTGNKSVSVMQLRDDASDHAKPDKGSPHVFLDGRCVYSVDFSSVVSMESFWEGLFGPAPFNASLSYLDDTNLNATLGPGWLQTLYQKGNITFADATQYFEGIARAMTGVFRTHASSGDPAIGTVMGNETCIRVRWAWLTLPATLLLLSVMVFAATVIQSRRHTSMHRSERARAPWKSSTMPLLWCGIADEVRTRYGAMDSLNSMKGTARTVRVSLSRMGDGQERPWTLKEDRFWY